MGNDLALEALLEFLNGIEAGIVSARRIIKGKQVEGGFQERPYERLVWTNGKGAKGPYQMARLRNNGGNNLFLHLLAILKQNGGRFAEESWLHYYWLGSDGDIIFRRLKKQS